MASTHKHIRSGTANKRPTTAIADGQIALNTNLSSPGLFFKDSTGAEILKIGPVHVGATAPNASPAGSAGNSTGEIWLDTSLTPVGVKIWNGSAFVNATPIGSTTVQGLLELATDAETQAGADTARAVTPASLQSKLSDSTSTTSNTTIASSTAVKAAYDLANAALPKTGGTVTGNLEIGTAGSLSFEGATADGFETTIAVVDPTADRTITLPNTTGTVVTTGDTGTVTSTMLLDGTIVDADINANAEISVSKLVDGSARQLLQTDAAGTGVEWASNIDIPGTLDVTSAATFDSTVAVTGALTKSGSNVVTVGDTGTVTSTMILDGTILNADVNASAAIAGTKIAPDFGAQTIVTTGVHSAALGAAATPSITFTGDLNTGIFSPGADQLAVATNGVERLRLSSTGEFMFKGAGTTPGTDKAVSFNGSAPVNSMVLDSSGRLGIGTSSPSTTLDVRGNAQISGSSLNFSCIGDNTVFNVKSASNTLSYLGPRASSGVGLQKGYFALADTGVDKIQLDSAGSSYFNGGNVGIGTNAPAQKLEIMDGSISIGSSANINTANVLIAGYGYILSGTKYGNTSIRSTYENTSNTASLDFYVGTGSTGTAEKMRLDAQGRLLVGTSTSPSLTDGQYSKLHVIANTNTASGEGVINIGRGQAASSAFAPGTGLGNLFFTDSAGAVHAAVAAATDGTTGAGDYPGRLVFSTTADGAASPTERMRISNGGFVNCLGFYSRTTATAANMHVDAGGDVYRSTSSAKYKTDIETIQDSYADALLQCRPVWYRSTCPDDNSNWGWWGFIAEEVAAIDPRLVHWKTVEVTYDEKGAAVQAPCEPEPEGVQYDRFVPHLLNLIKRQGEAIADLQAEVAALKSA